MSTSWEQLEATMSANARTRALYNSDCPVCDSEMCSYAAYAESEGAQAAAQA